MAGFVQCKVRCHQLILEFFVLLLFYKLIDFFCSVSVAVRFRFDNLVFTEDWNAVEIDNLVVGKLHERMGTDNLIGSFQGLSEVSSGTNDSQKSKNVCQDSNDCGKPELVWID